MLTSSRSIRSPWTFLLIPVAFLFAVVGWSGWLDAMHWFWRAFYLTMTAASTVAIIRLPFVAVVNQGGNLKYRRVWSSCVLSGNIVELKSEPGPFALSRWYISVTGADGRSTDLSLLATYGPADSPPKSVLEMREWLLQHLE